MIKIILHPADCINIMYITQVVAKRVKMAGYSLREFTYDTDLSIKRGEVWYEFDGKLQMLSDENVLTATQTPDMS